LSIVNAVTYTSRAKQELELLRGVWGIVALGMGEDVRKSSGEKK
jgi:hypothetical protein